MRLFGTEEVRARLAQLDVVGIVEGAILAHTRSGGALPAQSCLTWETLSGGRARSLSLPVHIGGPTPTVGVKVINSSPANVDRGLPRASGLTLVFDPETAVVRFALPAQDISAARTAAVSALALRSTARTSSRGLAVIGCGPVADWHVRVISGQPTALRELVVFDTVAARAEAFLQRWRPALPDWEVRAATDAETAVRSGDVVIAATTTTTPYVGWGWIRRGATVVNVSLDDLRPEVFTECQRLFVDDWSSIVADEHRLLGRLARAGRVVGPGAVPPAGARAVDGTIGQLLAGDVAGRGSADEVVVVNPFGTALGDVALAAAVANTAEDG